MSVNDIALIIFLVMWFIFLLGSLVTMFFTYQNNKQVLDYLRSIIRMQECKIIEKMEEKKG